MLIVGVFLTLVMTLNAVSLVCATLIINVKKAADMSYCPSVPRLVFAFCRSVIGPLTCTAFSDVDYGVGPPHQLTVCRDPTNGLDGGNRTLEEPFSPSIKTTNGSRRLTVPDTRHAGVCSVTDDTTKLSLSPSARSKMLLTLAAGGAYDRLQCRPSSTPDVIVSSNFDDRLMNDGHNDFRFQRIQRRRKGRQNSDDQSSENVELKTYSRMTLAEPIRGYVGHRKTSMMSTTDDNKTQDVGQPHPSIQVSAVFGTSRREWCFLAETLDRLMFGLFLAAMLMIVLISLVIVPYCQRSIT